MPISARVAPISGAVQRSIALNRWHCASALAQCGPLSGPNVSDQMHRASAAAWLQLDGHRPFRGGSPAPATAALNRNFTRRRASVRRHPGSARPNQILDDPAPVSRSVQPCGHQREAAGHRRGAVGATGHRPRRAWTRDPGSYGLHHTGQRGQRVSSWGVAWYGEGTLPVRTSWGCGRDRGYGGLSRG